MEIDTNIKQIEKNERMKKKSERERKRKSTHTRKIEAFRLDEQVENRDADKAKWWNEITIRDKISNSIEMHTNNLK